MRVISCNKKTANSGLYINQSDRLTLMALVRFT